MELELCASGAWPRPEEGDMEAVLADQSEAGLHLVNDGLLAWDDPISFFLGKMEGVEEGEEADYLARPMKFRRPKIHTTTIWREPIVTPAFEEAKSLTDKPIIAVLTGPLTLGSCSVMQEGSYNDLGEFVFDIARSAMAREIGDLVERGAAHLQIDEPFLFRSADEFEPLRDSLELMKEYAEDAEVTLKLYWGEGADLFDRLQELPVDRLDLDCVSDPELAEIIAGEGSGKPVTLGLLDSRTANLEEESETLRALERLVKHLDHESTRLTLNGHLRPFLTREQAKAKCAHLAGLRKHFLGLID